MTLPLLLAALLAAQLAPEPGGPVGAEPGPPNDGRSAPSALPGPGPADPHEPRARGEPGEVGAASSPGQVPLGAPDAGEVALDWRGPDVCPGREEVLAKIEAALGRPLAAGPPRITLDGVIEPRPGGYRVQLEVRTAAGASHRRLEAPGCDALVGAVALIVGLALERLGPPPASAGTATVVEAPEEVEPPKRLVPFVPGSGEPAGSFDEDDDLEWRLGVAAGAGGARLLPHFGPAAQVWAGVGAGAFSFDLGLVHWFRQTRTLRAEPRAGAVFSASAGRLRGCGRGVLPWDLELGGCGLLELGALTGEGFGVAGAERQRAPWLLGGAQLRGGLHVGGPLWAVLAGEALLPIARPSFVVEGLGIAHAPRGIALGASLGVELRFR